MPRRMSGCDSRQPHQFLGCTFASHLSAIRISNKPRTSSCSRVSKTQPAWGSTRAVCQFSWGRGRQVMHLPCKQAHMGAVPIDSTNLRSVELRLGRPFHCGENEIQASLISSAFVGATPTPATIFGRCSGCRSVQPVSQNKRRKRRLEHYQRLPPFLDS